MGLGGFFKTIGKGLLGLIPGGGTASTILDVAGGVGDAMKGVGQAAGASAKGMADARLQEALLGLKRDELAQSRAKDTLKADQDMYRRMALMNLMNTTKNAQITGLRQEVKDRIPQVIGGFNPEAFAAGMQGPAQNAVETRVREALMKGQYLPELTELPQPRKLEKGLGWTGLIGGLLGGLPKGGKTGAPAGAVTAMNSLVNRAPVDIRNIGAGAFVPDMTAGFTPPAWSLPRIPPGLGGGID